MMESLLLVAVLIEAVITAVSMFLDREVKTKQIIAFFVGGIFLFLFGIDLLQYMGLTFAEMVPVWVGQVVSYIVGALLIFRFSGNFNDLFDWLNGNRQ